MKNTFGTPGASDDVARIEAAANSAMDRILPLFANLADRLPRAIGSVKQSSDGEFQLYLATVVDSANPEAGLQDLYSQWAGQYGAPVARSRLISYVRRNEDRLAQVPVQPGDKALGGNMPAVPVQ